MLSERGTVGTMEPETERCPCPLAIRPRCLLCGGTGWRLVAPLRERVLYQWRRRVGIV